VTGGRHDASLAPPGTARNRHRLAVLTANNAAVCQTMPAGRRTPGVGCDFAYKPADPPPQFHHHRRRQLPRNNDDGSSDAGRFHSSTLPRRDLVVTCRPETGNGRWTGSPPTGTGSGGGRGGRSSRLTAAVSEVDIAGGSTSHLLPFGGATDARSNHPDHRGVTSTSMLALPDTSV